MDNICSKPMMVAGRTIRNDGDCCNPVFTIYEGRPVCRFHYLRAKAYEECPICLYPMMDGGRRVMLNCNHFFHIDCLGECREPTCPICRQQLTGAEGAMVFTPTVFRPIIEQVYSLPKERIPNVTEAIGAVVGFSQKSDWHANHVNNIISYLQRASALAESIVEDRSTRSDGAQEGLVRDNSVDRFIAMDSIITNIVNMMYDALYFNGNVS